MDNKSLTPAEMGALGGKARAGSMSPQELSERARAAVQARWAKRDGEPSAVLRATHEGEIRIGDISIPCYVLENGARVISHRGLQKSLGIGVSGGAKKTADFVVSIERKSQSEHDLSARISSPIEFVPPNFGRSAFGYEATVLHDICELILSARQQDVLSGRRMEKIAAQCEILVRGFARVGIIALVDEATGYQYDRPRRELEGYLSKFLSESLRRWVRTFPADYFKELCRLRGVELRPDMKLPQYFGHLTNNLIYRRIAPGLLHRLKERREERGSQSNKLTWWLSDEVGRPELLVHLGIVVGLMKINTDYSAFEKQLDQITSIYPKDPGLFDDPKDWEPR